VYKHDTHSENKDEKEPTTVLWIIECILHCTAHYFLPWNFILL